MTEMEPIYIPLSLDVDRQELDGITLLCLSDTHDFQESMPKGPESFPQADILVHAGDFTTRGTSEEIANFKQWMERLLVLGIVKHVVVVAGNHELSFQPWKSKHPAVREKQEQMKQSITTIPNLHYLEDSAINILGVRFYGSPWTTPVNGKFDWAF